MKKFILIAMAAMLGVTAMAQPAKRRTVPTDGPASAARAGAARTQTSQGGQKGTDRASLMFPTSDPMPDDVAWKRDVYRQLDLTRDKNAPLYYPVQPVGKQVNLFTYLFRLMLTGRVSAYDYKITGNESFEENDKVQIQDFLKRYSIYYEENNGKLTVADADVPSAQVKRYYIKESSYLDQRTGTTHTKVLAICPILLEGAEFSSSDDDSFVTSQPLFWMKYDDIAPYLSKLPIMASDMNNVSNMSADDYFTMNRYEGKIYKTNNMQGKVIADYCKTDSDMVKEQKRIEKQLTDFEKHLWGHTEQRDSLDSVAVAAEKAQKAGKKKTARKTATVAAKSEAADEAEEAPATNRRTEKVAKKEEAAEEPKAASRVSARRQRR